MNDSRTPRTLRSVEVCRGFAVAVYTAAGMSTDASTGGRQLQTQLDKQRRTVDVDRFDITVRELHRMGVTGELHRAPAYQRKFRWDDERESALIESILLGLPVPSVFVATNPDGKWELVDGLQRISTLLHFVTPTGPTLKSLDRTEPLRLTKLRKLTRFNDLLFDDLPAPIQLHFFKRPLPVTALSDKSDFVVRFDMFERLNRGGVALTPQEVRACIFGGKFNDLIEQLSREPAFASLVKLRRAQKDDGTKAELVLKFFAYLYDREQFEGAVTQFLNDYMKNEPSAQQVAEGSALFRRVTSALAEGLDGPVLRTGTYVTPLNQLEAILVGGAEVLRSGRELSVPSTRTWLDDPVLVAASTKGTNTPSMLRSRIDRAAKLLSGTRSGTRRTPKARA